MKVFLLLVFARLIYLACGYPDGSEFGRVWVDANIHRRTEHVILNTLEGKRQTRRKKLLNWQAEESFMDIQRATLELSISFSLSLSMSGPNFPSTPTVPSGSPIISTLSPTSSPSPAGPSNENGSPSTPGGSNSPTGLTNVQATFEPSEPSGDPGPTEAPISPPSTPVPPSNAGSPSISTRPTNVSTPVEPPGPSGAPEPTEAPMSPLTPIASALVPTLPPFFSGPTEPIESSDPPQNIAPSVLPVLSPIAQPQPPIATPIKTLSSKPSTEPPSSGLPTGTSDCLSISTLVLGTAADESSTPVALDIGYHVESNTSSIEEFEAELVEEFIRTAAFAIFGCNPETRGKIATNTEEIIAATCDPTVDGGNECFVLQTTLIIGVEGPVETDAASYEAYKSIQESMEDGTYTDTIPDVVFLEFVSPLPLLEPSSTGGDGGSDSPNRVENPDFQRNVDVSPWTIGFSVASVMGGIVSLLVYERAKRNRQNRRLRLDETTPWVSQDGETVV